MAIRIRNWYPIFIISIFVIIIIYAINSFADEQNDKQSRENQDYIISTIENNSALRTKQFQQQTEAREQEFQAAKLAILNNITHKIDQNTLYLEKVVKSLNITEDIN